MCQQLRFSLRVMKVLLYKDMQRFIMIVFFTIFFKPIKIMLNADTQCVPMCAYWGSAHICLFKCSVVLFCKCDEFKKGSHFYKKLVFSQK